MSTKLQIIAGSVSLTALLAYTLVHTGGLLATYVNPWWIGFVAAGGIELAVVSLSLRIGDLKRSGQGFRFFMFVLVSVVIVSALANISQGFTVAHKAEMTLQNIRQLDAIQAIIGLTATGLISLIVLALSEIIGVDVNTIVRESEKEQRRQSRIVISDSIQSEIELARTVKAKLVADKKQALADLRRTEPDITPKEAQTRLGISKSTYYSYVAELEANGNGRNN